MAVKEYVKTDPLPKVTICFTSHLGVGQAYDQKVANAATFVIPIPKANPCMPHAYAAECAFPEGPIVGDLVCNFKSVFGKCNVCV